MTEGTQCPVLLLLEGITAQLCVANDLLGGSIHDVFVVLVDFERAAVNESGLIQQILTSFRKCAVLGDPGWDGW